MDDGDARNATAAEERFALWLERRSERTGEDFDAFVAETPDLERELRRIKNAWDSAQETVVGARRVFTDAPPQEFGYVLLEELGRGGFGRVHRAHDRGLRRDVAVKIVDAGDSDEARRRFVAEAQLLASVDHPNVVRVHAVVEEEGEVRLVTELLKGRTLAATVSNDGPLGEREAATIGIEVCRALSALHGRGLVHLDVKPGNVMRVEGGRVVLLDFGFARERMPSDRSGDRPLGGTPPFMAPEHLLGADGIGPAADVYGLAATLYWCVTGAHPFDFDREGVVDRVLAGSFTPLSDARADVDADFAAIVERGLSRVPSKRFASAGEFEAALRRWLASSEGALHTAGSGNGSRNAAWIAALVVVATAGVLWFLRDRANDLRAGDGTGAVVEAVPLEVSVRFLRRSDGGTQGTATEGVELGSDDPLPKGAQVWFEVTGSEPFYLYIFNQDAEGSQYCLVPERDVPDFCPAGDAMRFPSTGQLSVTNLSSREHVFVIASQDRVPWLDMLLPMLPRPSQTDTTRGRVKDDDVAQLRSIMTRGIGGRTEPVAAHTETRTGAPDLVQLFEEYRGLLEASRERVVFEHYELVND
ncbi:MAG: protein kinase [Planctomycetota bacterium]